MTTRKKSAPAETAPVVLAFKGFDTDWKCRGYQFAVGQTYTQEGPIHICESGFHACENPMDVWYYYPPGCPMAAVELSGEISRKDDGDSKVAGGSITVKAEVRMPQIIEAAVKWIFSRARVSETRQATSGDYAHSATSGYSAHSATSGNSAHSATSGNSAHSATSGDYAHSATSGNYAHSATSGNSAHSATSGDYAHSATSGNYSHSATSGNYANSATSGNSAQVEAKGKNAVAANAGNGKARAGAGGAIFIVERDRDLNILAVFASKVGENGIKADTWYALKGGKPVESP